MTRKSILVLLGVVGMAALMAIPAGAGSATRTSSAQKVFRSQYCKARINQYNPSTWACTTITVNPFVVEAGATTTVTFAYKAKIRLKFVKACFSGMYSVTGFKCLYQHRFWRLRRGRVIKRTISIEAPSDGSYGSQRLDNLTRFYKKGQKWADTNVSYWPANAAVCVTTASQPNACSVGR